MKSITVLFVSIIGLAYCVFATPSSNQLYSVCETSLDWLRNDDNALTYMKYDEDVSSEFIQLLESDESSENICNLLAVRDADNEFIVDGVLRAVGSIFRGGSWGGAIKGARIGAKIGRQIGGAIRDLIDNHHHNSNREYAQ